MKMSSIIQMISSKHFQVEQLADGVYASVHRPGGLSIGNACIIDLGDQTLVFDTFLTPQAAIDLNLAAEALTDKPVTLVVNSHHHSDHTWGNQAFAPEADVIASEGTRKLLVSCSVEDYRWFKDSASDHSSAGIYNPARWGSADPQVDETDLQTSFSHAITEALPRLRFRYPNLTFGTNLELHGSTRSVELLSFAGGHTLSDTVLWIPGERILAAGDLLYNQVHPYLQEALPLQTLAILQEIEKLEPHILIPGHGLPGGIDLIHTMQGYLSRLIDRADDMLEKEQLVSAVQKTRLPAAYQSWQLGINYSKNLHRAYTVSARARGLLVDDQKQELPDRLFI